MWLASAGQVLEWLVRRRAGFADLRLPLDGPEGQILPTGLLIRQECVAGRPPGCLAEAPRCAGFIASRTRVRDRFVPKVECGAVYEVTELKVGRERGHRRIVRLCGVRVVPNGAVRRQYGAP